MSKAAATTAVDVIGRKVSWSPAANSDRLYGEVCKVWYDIGADPRYPKGSRGYNNGIRALFKKMSVVIPDGRILNMSAEQGDLKAIGMIAESTSED